MAVASFSTLGLAAVIDAPAIWHAAVLHDLPGLTALIRYLIAVPIAAVMLAVLRMLTSRYGRTQAVIHARAERLDDTEAGGTGGRQPPA